MQIQKCHDFFGINSKNVMTFSELPSIKRHITRPYGPILVLRGSNENEDENENGAAELLCSNENENENL